jgi:hypothetical protein
MKTTNPPLLVFILLFVSSYILLMKCYLCNTTVRNDHGLQVHFAKCRVKQEQLKASTTLAVQRKRDREEQIYADGVTQPNEKSRRLDDGTAFWEVYCVEPRFLCVYIGLTIHRTQMKITVIPHQADIEYQQAFATKSPLSHPLSLLPYLRIHQTNPLPNLRITLTHRHCHPLLKLI